METEKDDKSIVEKTVEAVKGLAASISEAARKTAEPEPAKPGDEVVVMPMATAGLMSETVVPPFVVVRRPRKSKKARAKSARNTAKTKSATKAPKSTKRSKSSTVRKAVGKKSRKPAKTAAKKSRR
jgi:hypothetical protein